LLGGSGGTRGPPKLKNKKAIYYPIKMDVRARIKESRQILAEYDDEIKGLETRLLDAHKAKSERKTALRKELLNGHKFYFYRLVGGVYHTFAGQFTSHEEALKYEDEVRQLLKVKNLTWCLTDCPVTFKVVEVGCLDLEKDFDTNPCQEIEDCLKLWNVWKPMRH